MRNTVISNIPQTKLSLNRSSIIVVLFPNGECRYNAIVFLHRCNYTQNRLSFSRVSRPFAVPRSFLPVFYGERGRRRKGEFMFREGQRRIRNTLEKESRWSRREVYVMNSFLERLFRPLTFYIGIHLVMGSSLKCDTKE